LFGPGSVVWRVGRERALLAGGTAALLLQVAHPLVAAGVAEHSDFRANPFLRLRTTLDRTLTITFGDSSQAAEAADRVRATHERIRGRLGVAASGHREGARYEAKDPDLAMWVHATLVVTALEAYARFVEPLDQSTRALYFEEVKRFGALFGADERVMPSTYPEFVAYVGDMIESRLLVTAQARLLAQEILRPPVPSPFLPAWPLNRLVTAGLLPARLRTEFGLPWGNRETAAFGAAASMSRSLTPLLPGSLRYWPHYRKALSRTGATGPP
jgi:uncharacterized protein (DUF2236 family)